VIDPIFVVPGSLLMLSGAAVYVRDTWRGETAPNRVTWVLWGLEPFLAFAVERQEHVGLASYMTLVFGLIPVVVLAVSFHDPRSVWQIGRFDIACGVMSVVGLIVWATAGRPTEALVAFVAADAVAALPTFRKAIIAPQTESAYMFFASAIFSGITVLTLRRYTTAGGLFPTSILSMDTVICCLLQRPRLTSLRARRQVVPT
jgi:hypothetical protein